MSISLCSLRTRRSDRQQSNYYKRTQENNVISVFLGKVAHHCKYTAFENINNQNNGNNNHNLYLVNSNEIQIDNNNNTAVINTAQGNKGIR